MEMKKGSVLIADDDKQAIEILTEILSEDCTIYAATDGEAAIKAARENKPDVILLDIVMPGLGGYETLRALKEDEIVGDTPVIIITGLGGDGEEEKGLEMGAVDFIKKPFKSKIVGLRVRQQINLVNQLRLIEHFSMTDKLTQLPNRRFFDKHIDIEWSRAMRDRTPLGILMMDIDHFKPYNDTYGHSQGDTALREVAKVFYRSAKRKSDFIARWGGEEFVVILPNTALTGALVVAESIRRNVEREPIYLNNGKPTFITISIGANSVVPEPGMTIEEFIANTDKALYEAKQNGRNVVCRV